MPISRKWRTGGWAATPRRTLCGAFDKLRLSGGGDDCDGEVMPPPAVHAYLKVIEAEPEMVKRAAAG